MAMCFNCGRKEAGRNVSGGVVFCSPACAMAWSVSLARGSDPLLEDERVIAAAAGDTEPARMARKKETPKSGS